MVLKRWQKVGLSGLAIAGLAYGASFLFAATHQVCRPDDYDHIKECSDYHLGPAIIAATVAWTDIHNGLVTACATIAIACLTWGLIFSSNRLAAISNQQTALLEAQRLIDHRPRLSVRHVMLAPGPGGRRPEELWTLGQNIFGGLAVVNVGGTPARIVNSSYAIFFSRTGLPMASPLDVQINRLIFLPQTLTVGQSLACPIQGVVTATVPSDTFIALKSQDRDGFTIYVMGQIEYEDSGGNSRFMGFCRQWSGGHSTFDVVTNPDYEYQD